MIKQLGVIITAKPGADYFERASSLDKYGRRQRGSFVEFPAAYIRRWLKSENRCLIPANSFAGANVLRIFVTGAPPNGRAQ